MLVTTPARARRALIATVLAACALPAAASAGTVEQASDGSLHYRGSSDERNTLSAADNGGGVDLQDLAGLTSRTPLCAQVSRARVRCAIGTRLAQVTLGAGDDLFGTRVSSRVTVDGGTGNDVYAAGTAPGGNRVDFTGGNGFDTVSYTDADRGVFVNPDLFDGRSIDQDVIRSDVERIVGSRFADRLTALDTFATLAGGPGDDVLIGRPSSSFVRYDMGSRADGADRIEAGGTTAHVDYRARTVPVTVTLGAGGADDGEAGERDELLPTAGSVTVDGGQAGDVIRAAPGSRQSHSLHGHGGGDRIEGGDAADFVEGGAGVDTLVAGGGDDTVSADEGTGDVVGCGAGTDLARLDGRDVSSSCETRRVGVLRLTPAAQRADAGATLRLRVSWRHPRAWRELRTIAVRLTDGRAPVGAITVHAGRGRIVDEGAVVLVRRATRLTRRGRTVTARLALRLAPSLAGRTLAAHVEATDRRGARQLERDAATVRLAP